MRTQTLLLVGVLLLAGCVTIEIDHTIGTDGTGSVSILYQLPADLMAQAAAMGDNTTTEENPCTPYENTSYACVYDATAYALTLTKPTTVPTTYLTAKNGLFRTTYEYDARYALTLLEELGTDDSGGVQEMIDGIEAVGGTITYKVTLPQPVLTSNVGTITENTVEIDMTELSTDTPAIITAQKDNAVLTTAGLGVLIVLIVIIILVVIIKVRRHHHNKELLNYSPDEITTGANNISNEERRYRDYIWRYENTYTQENIKTVLVRTGVDERDAQKYLDKYYKQH